MAMIKVEVAYVGLSGQALIELEVEEGATALEAIKTSGVLAQFPGIDLDSQKIGIFSRACSLERVLQAGDRVEIYRPLAMDPKEARRLRAQRQN